MANGNQDFSAFDASGTLTQPQITQRLSIIDQLLQAIPSTDPPRRTRCKGSATPWPRSKTLNPPASNSGRPQDCHETPSLHFSP
jgi:hypothetical protein